MQGKTIFYDQAAGPAKGFSAQGELRKQVVSSLADLIKTINVLTYIKYHTGRTI
jgi:hypothetical protein